MKAYHHTIFTSDLDGYNWSASLNPGKKELSGTME
jgi:hypothetical protein